MLACRNVKLKRYFWKYLRLTINPLMEHEKRDRSSFSGDIILGQVLIYTLTYSSKDLDYFLLP